MKISHLDQLVGRRVVVTADYGTTGYLVVDRHLNARRIGARGVVTSHVPGHGGDVVVVEQDDGDVGVYCHLNELEFETPEAIAFAQQKISDLVPLVEAFKAAGRAVKEARERPMPNVDEPLAAATGTPVKH